MGFLDRIRDLGKPKTSVGLDRLMLAQLRARGADLARPRHLIHYVYFPTDEQARRAADEIRQGGYEVTMSAPAGEIEEWSVRAEATRVVDETTVDAFREWFEAIAERHGGEYDGWEAAARP